MRASLSIAVAQPLTIPHNVAHNVERHADSIRSTHARIVVFPEMSLTGYEFDAEPIDPSDERLTPLIEAARESDAIALAGAPVPVAGGDKSIGMIAVDQTGASVVYRKMWLGAAELEVFIPGTEPVAIDVDGWRLGLAVCKDTGIPEHAAATAALGIDVYLAGVLERAEDRDVQPNRAMRITADHGMWFAVASYAGTAGEGFDGAAGESTIWRPDGTIAARAGVTPGEVVSVAIENVKRET